MSFLEINNVRVAGISACVPKEIQDNLTSELFSSEKDASVFISTTGIERRHISNKTTSDLCFAAAEKLINELRWDKEEIDVLIFVSQTPDYILPATSCILQDRLGLNKECYALDISLGCSGYVYGLSAAASLISTGIMKKALLLCGDAAGRSVSENGRERCNDPLFGHAGTVTALEYFKDSAGFQFHFGTDGSGHEAIIIPEGGSRNPFNADSLTLKEYEQGKKRNALNEYLNGMDVFTFGITKAPETIKKLTSRFNIDIESIDYFIFHQANKMMIETIRKKLKIQPEKVPYGLKDYGNTSSASIPLVMVTELKKSVINKKIIICGFGVGLSWATASIDTDSIVILDVLEI